MKKLKNCFYKKVYADDLYGATHYFEIYDLDKNFIASVQLWNSVLAYNKYGVINE